MLDPKPQIGPTAWVRDRLRESLWSKQSEIGEALVAHRRVAVKSCHGAGKSFVASRLVAWWLDTHPPGTAFVVSTAPTFEQVRAVLWREIGRAHAKGRLLGRVNQTEWFIGEGIVAMGRKPADDDATAFQGIHAEFVLVIMDEACGIPRPLWEAAHSLASNDKSRILAIGNPDDPGSHFAAVCKPGSGWHVIRIGYLDTPNFTGESVPADLRSLLIGPTYVEEMRLDVGEGSAPWTSKVMGEFPTDAEDGVVPLQGVLACRRPDQTHSAEDLLPVELGWDVGAGGDRSVVRERRGKLAGRVWYPKGKDTMAQCGDVLGIIAQTGATSIKIDSIGVGHGAADRMEELRRDGTHSARVVRVNVSESSSKPNRYHRLRDQLWWEVGRQMTTTGAWDLSQINDATVAQLTSPKYAMDSSGRIKVEAKSDTKARLGRSPDDADALLLAFYQGRGQGAAFLDMWKAELGKERPDRTPDELRHLPRMERYSETALSRHCQHRFFDGMCVKCQGRLDAKSADPL